VITINTEPDWIAEVATCVLERESNRSESTIEKSEVYGYSKDAMTEKFTSYNRFRQAVTEEIVELYEKDQVLVTFFKETEHEKEARNNLSSSFLLTFEDYLEWKGIVENASIFTNQKSNYDLEGKRLKEAVVDYATNNVDLLDMTTEIMGIKRRATSEYQLSDLMKELYQFDVPDDFKMKLMWIFSNYEELLEHLGEFYKKAIPVVKKYFPIIEKDFNTSREHLLSCTDLSKMIEEETGMKLPIMKEAYYTISILPYNYLSLTLLDERFFINVGMFMLQLSNNISSLTEEALTRAMKALGEPNRMQIMKLLSNEQMFLQELAEHLHLTTATVSHHIAILCEVNLIMVVVETQDKKRIYYQVCKDTLLKITASLQEIAGNL